jgi:hypothetical protein
VAKDDPDGNGPFLVFSGGQCIPIDGPLRVAELPDGWYVIGHNSTVPCGSQAAARDALRHLLLELDPDTLAAEALERLELALPEVDVV